jgi:hypothetical protein
MQQEMEKKTKERLKKEKDEQEKNEHASLVLFFGFIFLVT